MPIDEYRDGQPYYQGSPSWYYDQQMRDNEAARAADENRRNMIPPNEKPGSKKVPFLFLFIVSIIAIGLLDDWITKNWKISSVIIIILTFIISRYKFSDKTRIIFYPIFTVYGLYLCFCGYRMGSFISRNEGEYVAINKLNEAAYKEPNSKKGPKKKPEINKVDLNSISQFTLANSIMSFKGANDSLIIVPTSYSHTRKLNTLKRIFNLPESIHAKLYTQEGKLYSEGIYIDMDMDTLTLGESNHKFIKVAGKDN